MERDVETTDIGTAAAMLFVAMQAADTDRIEKLTAPEFTLTHIGGYVQPLQQWLSEIRAGAFVYYQISVQDLQLGADDDAASVDVRTMTDAHVYGSRNHWRLRLRISYRRASQGWIAQSAVATLW